MLRPFGAPAFVHIENSSRHKHELPAREENEPQEQIQPQQDQIQPQQDQIQPQHEQIQPQLQLPIPNQTINIPQEPVNVHGNQPKQFYNIWHRIMKLPPHTQEILQKLV